MGDNKGCGHGRSGREAKGRVSAAQDVLGETAAVWEAWQKHHPGTRLTKPRRKRIAKALAEASVEEVVQAIEWFHRDGSWFVNKRKTTFEHLFTWGRDAYSFTSLLDQIRESASKPTPKLNGHPTAERAWTMMRHLVVSHPRPPERYHDRDDIDERMRAATRSVGGWRELATMDRFSEGAIERRWCASYEGVGV